MTPQELVNEAAKFGDLVMSEGWKQLLLRVNDFLVKKAFELRETTYAFAFAKTSEEKAQLSEKLLDMRADLRAVSVMFSIPMNVIDATLAQQEAEDLARQGRESVPELHETDSPYSPNGHKPALQVVSR